MKRYHIGPRLVIAFAIMILFMFLGSAISLYQANLLQTGSSELAAANERETAILRVHNTLLTYQTILENRVARQETTSVIENADRLAVALEGDIHAAITTLNANPERLAERMAAVGDLAAIRQQIPNTLQRLKAQVQAGDWSAAQVTISRQIQPTTEHTQRLMEQLSSSISAERTAATQSIVQTQRNMLIATVLLSIVAVGVAIALAVAVIRSITQPLRELDKGAQAWLHGDFHMRVAVTSQDELGNLSHAFNNAAAQLADLYGNLEGLVAQRTTELQRRALQLETSIAVGQSITSILDLDTLLTQVAALIKERFDYHYVGVFLLDSDGTHVRLRAGSDDLVTPELTLKVGEEGIVGWTAANREPALVRNVAYDSRYLHWDDLPDTKSELALPLMMGDQLLGVLDIQSQTVGAINEDDLPVLQSLAHQVAIAIQNASFYQAEMNQRDLAETLHQIGRALTSTLNLSEVLDLILEQLDTIVPYDRGSVLLRNGSELVFTAARGFTLLSDPLKTRVAIHSEDENDVFSKIYRTKRPLSIDDVASYPSWRTVKNIRNPGSWLGIPLLREGEVIGILSLARLEQLPYQPYEISAAEAFADQAAVALENAQLYERITRFNQHLEYEVHNRTEALRSAYAQLEQLDRTKSNFISIASHELRTPITILKGYSQILLKDPKLQGDPHYENMLQGILKGTMRLHAIVESMLDMAKIDDHSLEIYPERLSIYDLVREVFASLERDVKDRQISFTMTPALAKLPRVEADLDSLRKVFYHLIVNAIKYTPDGGGITVDGRAWSETEGPPEADWPSPGIEVVVQDTGIGIDPQNQHLIFNKFYQTGEVSLHSTGRTKFKGGGPGLGLAITQGIVAAHRGRLWVESAGYDEEALPGSAFHLVLPLLSHLSEARRAANEGEPLPMR